MSCCSPPGELPVGRHLQMHTCCAEDTLTKYLGCGLGVRLETAEWFEEGSTLWPFSSSLWWLLRGPWWPLTSMAPVPVSFTKHLESPGGLVEPWR